MSDDKRDPGEAERDRVLAVWQYASSQKQARPPQLTSALSELAAWLDDSRQCGNAGVGHWRAQLRDVETALEFLVTLAGEDDRDELIRLLDELRATRSLLRGPAGISEWIRSRLRILSVELACAVDSRTLLQVAWEAILQSSASSPRRAVLAVHATIDLACRRGPSIKEVTDRVRMALQGEREQSASECVKQAQSAVLDFSSATTEVVWLEIVEARLYDPPVLAIGDAFLFVADSVFLKEEVDERGLVARAPELGPKGRRGWLFPDAIDSSSEESQEVLAVVAKERPRAVYARVAIPPTPTAQAYERASEQVNFLLGMVGIQAATENIWHMSGSHWLVGASVKSTHRWYDEGAAWKGAGSDEVARVLAGYAERLAPHFPLVDVRWKTVGLLLSWLREASRADPATRLILCDRVLEQVAGWAGFDDPQQLVTGPIRSSDRLRSVISLLDTTYIHLLNAEWPRPSERVKRLEVDEPLPPHSAPTAFPTRSRTQVIELVAELADGVPPWTAAAHHLRQLRQLLESRSETAAFLKERGAAFDRRNAHLRRTRNALLHGGPIVSSSVEHVSSFALSLANIALGDALEVMLDGDELSLGLVRKQREREGRLERLASGQPWETALFA